MRLLIIGTLNGQIGAASQIAMKRGAEARQWRFGDMPAQPDLSESQMAAVIAYVRAVQKANGID